MGLLDFIKRQKPQPVVRLPTLDVDLGLLSCGHTPLGAKPDPRDPFAPLLQNQHTISDQASGLEISVKNGILDSLFITLAQSTVRFFQSGKPLRLSTQTTVAEIQTQFGLPYWVDRDSDEVIFFYEYRMGEVELQFEFPGRERLGFITMAVQGILSNKEQRSAYGVTKPWPP